MDTPPAGSWPPAAACVQHGGDGRRYIAMHSAAGQGHDINRQSGESAPAQVARRARRQRVWRQAHRDPKQRLKTPRHGGAGGHGRPGSDPGALLRPRITGAWRGAQPTG